MGQRELERALTRSVDRRRLTAGTGAGLGVALGAVGFPMGLVGAKQAAPAATPALGGSPISLGVASGDPLPDSVVPWTWLAVDPMAEDGPSGMGQAPVEVSWELASDEAFGTVVQSGVKMASLELAHSLHVDISGLEPARECLYFYDGDDAGEESIADGSAVRRHTRCPRDGRCRYIVG